MSMYALLITEPRLAGLSAAPGEEFRAESRTDLVEALIPGYLDCTDEEKAMARFEWLAAAANTATAVLLGAAIETGDVRPGDLSQEEVDALLNTPRRQPVPWGEWTSPVPLVVLAETYRGHDLPTGNVIALDGTDETTLLSSLEQLGAVELFVREHAV